MFIESLPLIFQFINFAALVASVSYMWGRFTQLIESIDKRVKNMEDHDCMSVEEHDIIAAQCKVQIMDRVSRTEEDVKEIKEVIKEGERKRDIAREQDQASLREIRDIVIEVRTKINQVD